MKCYSYRIEHDYGLAPNPFHGYCTLAVCKSKIRNNRNLNVGDWIIGTGSVSLDNLNKLIFAMRLEEKITFNDYWNDKRFINKKPVINGSLVQMYGDNFYYEKNGEWIQKDSAHSLDRGKINKDHTKRDVDGKYVLISQEFYYFGNNALSIPDACIGICSQGRGFKSPSISQKVVNNFITWLKNTNTIGIHGDPISWKKNISEQDNISWNKQLKWEAGLMK